MQPTYSRTEVLQRLQSTDVEELYLLTSLLLEEALLYPEAVYLELASAAQCRVRDVVYPRLELMGTLLKTVDRLSSGLLT